MHKIFLIAVTYALPCVAQGRCLGPLTSSDLFYVFANLQFGKVISFYLPIHL